MLLTNKMGEGTLERRVRIFRRRERGRRRMQKDLVTMAKEISISSVVCLSMHEQNMEPFMLTFQAKILQRESHFLAVARNIF